MATNKSCDECGSSGRKVHRRYKELAYCGSCYARVFIKRKCPSCLATQRLHKDQPNAVCRKCERKKPCIRCRKSNKRVGKITRYGIVCASCAPYFKEREPCDICNRLSFRLTRVKRFNDDYLRCERCAIADYGSCKSCRRYRKLENLNGQMLCKLCAVFGVKNCKECGIEMGAGRGTRCEDCYWRELLKKRTTLNKALLSTGAFQSDFTEYTKWLGLNTSYKNAATIIAKHVLFFERVEKEWGKFPSYIELLKCFGAEHLRRNRKVIEWLKNEMGLVVDKKEKKYIIEELRIKKMISEYSEKYKSNEVISRYEELLNRSCMNGKLSILTMRLSLTPAIAVMKQVGDKGRCLPGSEDIKQYLGKAPGQRASLTKFITFLRKEYHIDLRLPCISEIRINKKHLEKKIVALASKRWGYYEFLCWCKYSLEYFHGLKLTLKSVKRLIESPKVSKDGIIVFFGKEKIYLPIPNQRLVN